jgi:predicted RNA-binding protein YlqC (UPF0109 family)
MKMSNSWIQNFKDALYAIDQFLKEKKPGQYPPNVLSLQTFIDVVLNNVLDFQIEEQLAKIVMTPHIRDEMTKGLMTKKENQVHAGVFFRVPNVIISLVLEGVTISMGISETLKIVGEHGRSIQDIQKAVAVNTYVVGCLSMMITVFITQKGPSIGMEKRHRDSIVSSTIVEPLTPPYHQGQHASAIKALVVNVMSKETITGLFDGQFGEGASSTISSAVERFNFSSLSEIQTGLKKALATKKIDPLIAAAAAFATDAGSGIPTNDGVKAYDQE